MRGWLLAEGVADKGVRSRVRWLTGEVLNPVVLFSYALLLNE